jgi:drug/metabolite transporter (DMT)-like permease
VAKFALDVVPPSTLAFMRFFIGGFFLAIIPNNGHRARLNNKDWKDLFVIGSFGLAISNALLNLGLQMTTSTKTAIAASLEPIFTIFLAALMLKEVLQRKTMLATAISILGASLLLLDSKTVSQLFSELVSSGGFLGDILVVLSIFTTALYSILMKPVAQRIGAMRATSLSFFIGAALLSPIAIIELSQLWPISFTRESLLAIMFLGVICNAVCYLIWNIILRHTEAGVMAVTLYAQPAGGVIVGWLWLGESLSTTGLIGACLIFAGIWLLPGESADK